MIFQQTFSLFLLIRNVFIGSLSRISLKKINLLEW